MVRVLACLTFIMSLFDVPKKRAKHVGSANAAGDVSNRGTLLSLITYASVASKPRCV